MKELNVILKSLADINRVRILKLLEKRHMCVCELAFVLKVTQPSVSRHLKKLISAGLVAGEQDGYWKNYYLVTDSKYAKSLLGSLKTWLNDDTMIVEDMRRAAKANREKLCCKK
ncbi:ArsR/SmtB family transcription factor [Candidatus Omnitrophota bacterium]